MPDFERLGVYELANATTELRRGTREVPARAAGAPVRPVAALYIKVTKAGYEVLKFDLDLVVLPCKGKIASSLPTAGSIGEDDERGLRTDMPHR